MAGPRNSQGPVERRRFYAELLTLRSLPKSQRSWALFFLLDIAGKAKRLPDDFFYIERSPGYYGRAPEAISKKLVSFLLGYVLQGQKFNNQEAYGRFLPIRKLTKESPYYGYHWVLPPGAVEFAADLAAQLKADGDEAPEGSAYWEFFEADSNPIQTIQKGKRTWMNCREHDDRDPSALINQNGIIYCFGCGKVVGKAEESSTGLLYRKLLSKPLPLSCRIPTPETASPITTEAATTEATEQVDGPMGFYLPPTGSASTLPYSLALSDSAGSPGQPILATRSAKAVGVIGMGQQLDGEAFSIQSGLRSIGLVKCLRHADRALTKYGKSGMSKSYSEKMDLLDMLRAANKSTRGKALQRAWEKQQIAEPHGDHRTELPDRYAHLDWCKHTATRIIPLGARGKMTDLLLVKPEGFKAVATEWVGVDLDGFYTAPTNDSELIQACKKVGEYLETHPSFTGRFGVIRTSHLGIQVVAQLKKVRWNPTAFYADPHVQRMLSALDHVALSAFREAGMVGGHIDQTIHSAGRLFRLPGARVDKNGVACLSKLIYATE